MDSYYVYFDEANESRNLYSLDQEKKEGDLKAVYDCLQILKNEVKRLIYEYQLKDDVKFRQWMYSTVNGIRKIQHCINKELQIQTEINLNTAGFLGDEKEKYYKEEKITEELLDENSNCFDHHFNAEWDEMPLEESVKDSVDSFSTQKKSNNTDEESFTKKSKESEIKEISALLFQVQEESVKYEQISSELKKREEAAISMLKLKHELDKEVLNKTISKLRNEISMLRRQSILPKNNRGLTRFSAIASPVCTSSPTLDLESVRKKLTSVNSTPLLSIPRPRPTRSSSQSLLEAKPLLEKKCTGQPRLNISLLENRSETPEEVKIKHWRRSEIPGFPKFPDHPPHPRTPLSADCRVVEGRPHPFHTTPDVRKSCSNNILAELLEQEELSYMNLMGQLVEFQSECECEAKSILDFGAVIKLENTQNMDLELMLSQKNLQNFELTRQILTFESKCRHTSSFAWCTTKPQIQINENTLLKTLLS